MTAHGSELLVAGILFVVIAVIVVVVVRVPSVRVAARVRTLAADDPAAIVFLGYVYPYRFGPLVHGNPLTSTAPAPFAFVADQRGIRAFGAWRRLPVRDMPWTAIARVEYEFVRASRIFAHGLTMAAIDERQSIDLRPGVPNLETLIAQLEALRAAAGDTIV